MKDPSLRSGLDRCLSSSAICLRSPRRAAADRCVARGFASWRYTTARATRQASEAELTANVEARARTMAHYGTTTAEAKSGYGLNLGDELKQLRAIRNAAAPARLIPTCLAAHEFPPERRGDATYVD